MTRQIHVDRVLDEWLAEGPSELPDRVIDGIVRQLEETEQRKPGWASGRYLMNRMMLAAGGLAAALVVAVLAVGLYANGLVPGAPPPSPSPTGVLYESERYGYSLLLPDENWQVIERSGEWLPGTALIIDGPGADIVRRVAEVTSVISVHSQPVPAGTTLGQYASDFDEIMGRAYPHCPQTDAFQQTTVEGYAARVGFYSCDLGRGLDDKIVAAVWLTNERAYALHVDLPAVSSEVEDARTEIDAWLERLRLAP